MGSWPKMADGDAGYVFTVQPCSQTAAPISLSSCTLAVQKWLRAGFAVEYDMTRGADGGITMCMPLRSSVCSLANAGCKASKSVTNNCATKFLFFMRGLKCGFDNLS